MDAFPAVSYHGSIYRLVTAVPAASIAYLHPGNGRQIINDHCQPVPLAEVRKPGDRVEVFAYTYILVELEAIRDGREYWLAKYPDADRLVRIVLAPLEGGC